MIKQYANNNGMEFDSKNFDISTLTNKNKNTNMPTDKRELIETMTNYINFMCFFDHE